MCYNHTLLPMGGGGTAYRHGSRFRFNFANSSVNQHSWRVAAVDWHRQLYRHLRRPRDFHFETDAVITVVPADLHRTKRRGDGAPRPAQISRLWSNTCAGKTRFKRLHAEQVRG